MNKYFWVKIYSIYWKIGYNQKGKRGYVTQLKRIHIQVNN